MNKVLVQKAFIIVGLTFIIFVALLLVSNTISDRQTYRDTAVHSIEQSYAGPQTLIGPVLVRPYTETIVSTETSDKGVKKTNVRKVEQTATSFPRDLNVSGTIVPSQRRHGLYNVTVYELQASVKGHYEFSDPVTEGTVVWGEPYLALSVADVRGIVGTPKVVVNGTDQMMLQGAPPATGWQANLRVPLRGTTSVKGDVGFAMSIDLAGTETLSIAPSGDSNHFELQSPWVSPLFAGQFLPRFRTLGNDGFRAAWDVSSLASGTQAQMVTSPVKDIDLISVSLRTLVDPYTLSSRAVKYGILFVLLTFGGFLLFELMKHLPIHPIQYLLVGFGLAIFFLLLVSFSEHLAFGLAYLLASIACIGLLTFYLSFVLRSPTRGLAFGAMLITLYTAIYGLLISEDNALVLGALMLFALLAGVMYVTRKVDWYRGAELLQQTAVGTSAPSPIETL